tara:strand:+ start:973 stop:1227 length:255 start_codon:yes stop_codon:yes gene_type:complete
MKDTFSVKRAMLVSMALHDMSVVELSARTNLAQGQLSALRSGVNKNPTINTIISICAALAMPISQFVAYGEPENEKELLRNYPF